MALFLKRDFSPPVLSPRWVAIKCRPNMLLRSRSHVVAILESGLLFREDSAAVEQEAEWSEGPGPGAAGWLTPGERWLSVGAVLVCVAIAPPTLSISRRGACVRACAYAGCVLAARCAHRRLARSVLPALLQLLVEYTTLARRTLLCLKEYKFLHRGVESMRGVTEAGASLLCRQQGSLAELMSRCSLALLGNVPWLYDDVLWDSVVRQEPGASAPQQAELAKVHHALLVIQSAFLKNIAMAHFVQPHDSRKIFNNHNERIYWLHTELLQHLYAEVKENYEALDRMYRLLKNFTTNEASNTEKISGLALNDSWLYSEVHAGVARATMELKIALDKCTGLDVFLDGCAMNKQRINVDTLNGDLESLIEGLMECVTTVQNSQIKLKKIQCKLNPHKVKYDIEKEAQAEDIQENEILKIEDKDPESKDEVFYFVKTEEDDIKNEATVDVVTAPGKKERDNTKIVLGELKKKLVKREDLMRHREKIALAKTMPELKGNLPEFPRQIIFDETLEGSKGYITKIHNKMRYYKKKLSKPVKHSAGKVKRKKRNKYVFQIKTKTSELNSNIDPKPTKLLPKVKHSNLKNTCVDILTISVEDKKYIITKWVEKAILTVETDFDSSDISRRVSEVESSSKNNRTVYRNPKHRDVKTSHESRHEKFVKEDLQLSASSSESDFDFYKERKEQLSLLKDIRRHRAARRKNHPSGASISMEKDLKKDAEVMDEGLKPVEYSFGTGMALASLVQGGKMMLPNMRQEEVFVGDGEVSSDSGNDEGS